MEAGARDGARALIWGLKRLPGELRVGAPLAELTTFRIGGPSWALFYPATVEALGEAISWARGLGIPWKVLGRGSNVLFPDRGFPGLVVGTSFLRGKAVRDGELVVEAGTPLGELVSEGFWFLAGIPGSVGGALVMNAGTRAGEIGTWVNWVEVLSGRGEVRRLTGEECGFSYRDSRLRALGLPVLRAGLRRPGGVGTAPWKILALRRATQPLTAPSAGCVFRNPDQAPAGWLIDRAGRKGLRQGDAMVSTRHANFIVNLGRASAADVLALIDRIRDRVLRLFGVWLELELEVVTL